MCSDAPWVGNDARDSLLKDKPCSIGSEDEKPEPGSKSFHLISCYETVIKSNKLKIIMLMLCLNIYYIWNH